MAVHLAQNGHTVRLWGRDARQIQYLERQRCNTRYLPGVGFPASITIFNDLAQALSGIDALVLAVPSIAFGGLLKQIKAYSAPELPIAWATKGLEAGSGRLLHQIVTDILGEQVGGAVISGPTFAREVAQGLPTAVTVASTHLPVAQLFATLLHNDAFRVYTTDDIIGVQLGGAVKNVFAIAAGIADGLHLGANTRAALITRALAELVRLGTALGGRRDTLMGLSGLGDLLLTCTDDQSRNRRLGLALATGRDLDSTLKAIGQVVEGAEAAREVMRLAQKHHVEMPIARQVHAVLYEGVPALEAVEALLLRGQKSEWP